MDPLVAIGLILNTTAFINADTKLFKNVQEVYTSGSTR